ncbi:glycosyltransferase family 4 protein [Synechococcus sp. CS-1324]|uniref:MraY family glycosyltransferase n=1 Tax=Synechococcus sp. CS-1324 TaxID=2847980 RepID=UPI000DB43AB8|nr:glycosyltransferase family 4 protein [Synechococcus sp. CS-1324]MCT0229506.1 glycosyltransferase family 4 protein [Synechococcus sp. CS-1324]PZV04886.1 MAG: glycosyl transferase [Cyanobium sp.]
MNPASIPQAGALAALSATLSWLLLAGLLPVLRQRLLDQPNARSSHRLPTPRGGGVAFVAVSCLMGLILGLTGSASWLVWLPLICAPLAITGFLDDRHDLPAALRFGIQALTAIGLISVAAVPLPWWILPLVVIGITAVVNFVNFMDGLDGLVAGCLAVVFAVAALRLGTEAPWSLVGALLGFLAWNWSPARVFMGDVGSTFLGAVFAGTVLQAGDAATALALLLVGFPLLADALICVLRRAVAGQPVFQAHRLHLYQRLHQAGWSHQQVATLYIAATGLGGLLLLNLGPIGLAIGIGLDMGVGLLLELKVAAPFQGQAAWRGEQEIAALPNGKKDCSNTRPN